MKYVLFALFVLSFGLASAQLFEEDTTSNEPFFKASKFHSSAYFQAAVHGGQILKNKGAGLVDFSLNWTINHKYVVSGQFFTIASRNNISSYVEPNAVNKVLIHHFAGIGFSYIFFSDKKFSLQPGLSGGWCVAKYATGNDKFLKRYYAAVIPQVSGVFNATKHFRIGLGVNYRAVVGQKFFALKASDLSGIGGMVFFRVGTF